MPTPLFQGQIRLSLPPGAPTLRRFSQGAARPPTLTYVFRCLTLRQRRWGSPTGGSPGSCEKPMGGLGHLHSLRGEAMGDHYFVSYSRTDGADFAVSLANNLEAGPPSYRVWIDVREMQPGRQDWDDQLVEAIQTCAGLLFVMTHDSVRAGSGCKDEWVWALKYKKPVIPVRLHADAELPFRLSSRQFVDFSRDFDIGLARLRLHLQWTITPGGMMQELRNRLVDAERELPRADPEQLPRIEQEIADVTRLIDEQRRQLDDPQAAREQAATRITTGLERERQPVRLVTVARQAKFVNPPPMTAPGYFQDRHVETKLIADFLGTDAVRLMSVVGRGGIGKTAMVCRLLKGLEAGRLPDDLGQLDVDGIVYLSPTGAHPISFPSLFADLCRLLPQGTAEPLLGRYRDPHETPTALMRALLEALPVGRTVVLLDNFEDLVEETLAVADRVLDEALRALLGAPAHGVKVILTSRVAPRELMLVHPAVQRRLDLDDGLESPYAEEVLRAMDTNGILGLRTAPTTLLTEAKKRTRGFPRALEALAAILAADRDTTLPELLADTEPMPENVVEALVGEAFSRLDPVAQQVMQALAIYATPVPQVAVDYLLQPYRPAINSGPVLGRLVNMHFVRRDSGRYYLHQVDRDYAQRRVAPGELDDRDAEPPPFTQYALRARGASYFKQTRTPRESWRNLDDLAAQLAEFELRHQAADYDAAGEVVLEIDSHYLVLWGHYRLVVDLHQRLQGHLADAWTDGRSKNSLAWCYYVLGDTRRAVELYQHALPIHREIVNRAGEALALNALGLCYAYLGEVRRAIDLHEHALAINRETGNRQGQAVALNNLGLCYSSLGEVRRAIDSYEQAAVIAVEIGDRVGEATDLHNLGSGHARLGETRRAIELYEQALVIARDVGDARVQAMTLARLGESHGDLAAWDPAIRLCEEGIEMADAFGLAQARGLGRLILATVYLLAGDLDAARETATAARAAGYPPSEAGISVVLGIALSRQGQADAAKQAFNDALESAEAMLALTPDRWDARDTKALALCGLAALGDPDRIDEAATTFRAARATTQAAGIVQRVLHLFDALAAGDETSGLQPIRSLAAGDGA
jgi:tetratricopeptide (TPR) repeat protein